jgi:hypothetical protein
MEQVHNILQLHPPENDDNNNEYIFFFFHFLAYSTASVSACELLLVIHLISEVIVVFVVEILRVAYRSSVLAAPYFRGPHCVRYQQHQQQQQ